MIAKWGAWLGGAGLLGLVGGCGGAELGEAILDARRDLRGALPVFPGAEGFGSTTPAGRGGQVLRVTSLAERGPGTLREALSTPGPRTVLFEIGGVIQSREVMVIGEPFVTVAGQSAPAPGITLAGAGLVIATHDVLLQHLRVRAGDDPDGPDPGGRDSLSIDGGPGGQNGVHDVVVDHCSFTWAIDEGASTWNPVRDVTFSSSLIAENLSHSLHPKGEHSKGLLLGDHGQRISVLFNLLAHNRLRNPIVKGDVSALLANNVIYNPGAEAIHLDDPEHSGPSLASLLGNVLIAGPDTNATVPLCDVLWDVPATTEVGLYDNLLGRQPLSRALFNPGVLRPLSEPTAGRVWVQPLSLRPAAEVLAFVLPRVGATPAVRDAVDARIVESVRTHGGAIIDSPAEVGGLPNLLTQTRSLQLPADPAGDDDGDGYTNLEEWLHGLAAAVEGAR